MANDVRASAPGEFGALRLASAAIAHPASGTTVDLDTLAVGDVILLAWAEVETVYNAGSTNVLTLGTTADDDAFLAAGDVAEGSLGASAAKGPFAKATAETTLRGKYVQTGGAATTGAARFYALIASAPA